MDYEICADGHDGIIDLGLYGWHSGEAFVNAADDFVEQYGKEYAGETVHFWAVNEDDEDESNEDNDDEDEDLDDYDDDDEIAKDEYGENIDHFIHVNADGTNWD